MPNGLVRYQTEGHFHFITFSCHDRRPYLASPNASTLFEQSLEKMRIRHAFHVIGYVVMPEHFHLLLSEPAEGSLGRAIQALKLSISVQSTERPFWQKRYYDFNVYSAAKRTEKLRYIHRNPVNRGLASSPDDWPPSSFGHYATGVRGVVEIESDWTAAIRDRAASSHVSEPRHGAPPGDESVSWREGRPSGCPISRL